ncbi:MAG: hypothetical protein MI802_23735 [Desulfobacterales bacterium]|nr:hypothetical protein [Desulfobacterales bacterium]
MMRFFALLSICLLWISVGAIDTRAAAKKVRLVFVCESEEVFPYFMGTRAVLPENPGATIEIVRLLSEYVPVDVVIQRLSLKRSFIALENGSADALVASYKPSRRKFGRYPMTGDQIDPLRRIDQSDYLLYVMKNSRVTWEPRDQAITGALQGIGAPFGYSIVSLLKETRVKVDEYGNTRENLVKLVSGHIDGAALLEFDADRIIHMEKERFGHVVKLTPPLSSKPYYLMLGDHFVTAHPRLSENIWEACRIIRKNRSGAIMRRYLEMALP